MSCSTKPALKTLDITIGIDEIAGVLDPLRVDAADALCDVTLFVSHASLLPFRPDLVPSSTLPHLLRVTNIREFDGAWLLFIEGERSAVILKAGTVLDWQLHIA